MDFVKQLFVNGEKFLVYELLNNGTGNRVN